ncbi:hypothetical protein NBRC116594_20030 [Shimia sp. NS0008-38b]|uniref:hypothetical protein n=1 Tax=Shimia sp. NS0008-38b TaxID=3127653 RepID=UPI003101E998
MRSLFLALPFVAVAASAHAQDVLFRSGEHEDFTRLVATLPTPDTEWTITKSGHNTYQIHIDGDNLNMRTNRIFDRIPRTRLSSVETHSENGTVELTLSCACRVVSIPYNERYVIFDIREGQPIEPEEVPQIPLSFGEAVPSNSAERIFRFSALEATKPVTLAPMPKAEVSLKPDFSGLLALENFVTRNVQVTTLRQDLIKQVDRAATQDLLEAQTALSETRPAKEPSLELASVEQFKTPGEPVLKRDHVPPQAAKGLEGQDLNIVAYNVIDEVGRDIAAILNGQIPRGGCLPNSAVNIADWSGTESFSKELARLRRKLVGEFDRTNDAALVELAKLYIHYTFGAEARQVLELLPDTGANQILMTMAHLVDGDTLDDAENAFAHQGHCSGHVSLWAALSDQTLTGDSAALGAMDALATLPRHLREHLGPKLSNKFVEQGNTESATLVLNAIERSSPKLDASYEFAQATLDAELGNTEEAEQTLSEIASQNSDMATVAVVELISSHLKQDLPPSADTISLVGALAVEHKAGAMGPSLRRAHALARMLTGEFEPAFNVVKDIEKHDGVEASAEVRDLVAQAMIENATDFDVLKSTLDQNLAEPGKIKPDTALILAHKLFDLGFVGETRRLLQAAQNAHENDKKRILKARVALADSLPRRAEAELMGLDTPEADRLRAEARSKAGDHEVAAQILTNLGDLANAETESWLGGNLQALATSETEVYRQASELFRNDGTSTPSGEETEARVTQGMLESNRSLLEESSESRGILGNLLDWHSLSDPSS